MESVKSYLVSNWMSPCTLGECMAVDLFGVFKFLKTCLSCLAIFSTWHQTWAEQVFPKRQLYCSNSIRVQVSVSKKTKATKTIFTERCHHLYLLLAHTDKDQRKFKKSIFTWRQLEFGQIVTSLIWDLNRIYSIVLLQYLLGPEALTVSCW